MTLVDAGTGEIVDVKAINAALERYEDVVDHGLKQFLDVGNALTAIAEQQLYRLEYASFDAYLVERWGMSRQRGYQLMEAARVTEDLSTMVDTPVPANERQARELAPVADDPEVAAQVMREATAAGGGKATAAGIRDVVTRFKKQLPPKRKAQPKAPVETVEAREARERQEALARDAARIEQVISGWPSLRAIAENQQLRADVEQHLTEPDRVEADRIIAIYLRGNA